MTGGSAALVGGLAAGLLVIMVTAPDAGPARLQRVLGGQRPDRLATFARRSSPSSSARARTSAAIVAGLAVFSVVGGPAGAGLAVVAGGVIYRILGKIEPRAVVAQREQFARDLPIAVHLVATAIAAGAPPVRALELSATGVGGPVGDQLRRVAATASLGGDLSGVCRALPPESPLGPLGRTIARALESGAPLAAQLDRLASDLRARRRADVDRQARSVGVRAAAPLGLCFLPAFLLVGVVPVVVGLASNLLDVGL